MFTVLSLIFGAFLWGFFALGILVLAMLLIEGFVGVVRIWKPNFFESYKERESRQTTQSDHRERRLIAIDYLIQERIRKQNLARQRTQQQFFPTAVVPAKPSPKPEPAKTAEPAVVDLTIELDTVAPKPKFKTEFLDKRLDHAAQWGIEKDGRYLCARLIRRVNGVITNRTAFAAVQCKAMRLDYGSAQRLLPMIPGAKIVPLNAFARQAAKVFPINGEDFNRLEATSA